MTDVAAEDRVLRLERLIAAPPERVFEYWTEPELFTKWMGPEGFDIPSYDYDLRPGGQWRQTLRAPDGREMTVRGVFRAVEPPRRLVYTWQWDTDVGSGTNETEVTVTFESAPGGTRLRLVHEKFQDKNQRDNHGWGWNSALDKLARVVAA